MSARERLEQYLDEVRQRLRAAVVARAGAVVALTALFVTLLSVWLLQNPAFPPSAVITARVVLIVSLLVAAGAMLWSPLRALQAGHRSRTFERHLPAQGGRIETYLELARRSAQGEPAPLIDLLAEDALAVAEQSPPQVAVPRKRMWIPAAIGTAAVLVLATLMMVDGSGWGFGSRHLWFGATLPKQSVTARSIDVKPGDATIRRNQDVPIRAVTKGFTAQSAEVYVRFGESKDYERAPMKVSPSGDFEFTLYALREPLSYYVVSQGAKSAEHHIFVADAPRVEKMRLTYNYPAWTGLPPETDENYRDINAVAGTKVEVEIQTSAPLDTPTLKVNGASADLAKDGNWSRGTLELKQAGTYRIHARVGDELVPLTDEYAISLVEDQKPTVEVAKPGRDWQASSIEEVPVRVHAKDDFRVQNIELHYSVNGGDWKVKPLAGRGKEVTDSTLMRLEEMGELQANLGAEERLTPGDIITYYAVAKDRKQAVQTDLFLIHVQPFERRFTQGQAGGAAGGGGAGEEQNAISQRQREILLATWNLERQKGDSKGREAERIGDNARMLSELQGTLADQARTLIQRAQARGVDTDPKNKALIENLEQAAAAMQPAAKHLGAVDFPQAIPSEQKALQHLLRAEALYTDLELQFRQANAGGGGSSAGRDLAEMFELEMDLDKNQYETESRGSKDQSPQQLAEAIQKLRELARRQEQLARQQANQQQTPRESDRWKQEQLKRETEQLRKQLEQLAQQNANSRGSQGQGEGTGESQSDTPGQSDGMSSSSGNSSSSQESARTAANNALNEVRRALQNMEGDKGDTRSAQASKDLKSALEKMEQGRRDGMAGSFDDLAQRAHQMLEEQRRGENEMLSAYSRPADSGQGVPNGTTNPNRPKGLSWERAEALAEQKRSLQNQIETLQRDMQASAQAHKEDAPQAANNVSSASEALAESNVGQALSRSAMELERGRGLQAAGREQLITEAIEQLENNLSRAAQVASNESQQRREGKDQASAEDLLAELSQLRRAWQEAQYEQRRLAQGGRGQPGQQGGQSQEPGTQNGQGQRPGDRNGQRGGQQNGQNPQSGANGQQPGSQGSQGQQSGGQQGDNGGSASGGAYANNGDPSQVGGNASNWGGGGGPDRWRGGAQNWNGGDRLNNWNPPLPTNALRPIDSAEFQRQAEAFARRFRDLGNRLPQGALPEAEIAALRRLANQLRASGRDPMESEYKNMIGLVDQLEIAALNAVEKNKAVAATRATRPAEDSPEYRETVAEYYRRLGSDNTK